MKSSIAPISLDNNVWEFCAQVSASEPVVLDVTPEPYAVVSECYSNVEAKVSRDGGRISYGWQIWEWPSVLIEAEFHAVWEAPSGELVDITPKIDGDKKIVFLPDTTRKYEGDQIDNIRKPISENRLVADFIYLCESSFSAFSAIPDGARIEGALAELYVMTNQMKGILIDMLKGGITRNNQCICGSGEKFKKCHAEELEEIIKTLRHFSK